MPDDAAMWGLNEDCPKCQIIIEQQTKEIDAAPKLRHVVMPESYGTRLVQEPEKRVQQFVVGDRTVTQSQFLAVVTTFRYAANRIRETSRSEGRQFPGQLRMLLKQLDEIESAVLYPNNITDWDWLEGVGDSYIDRHQDGGHHKGDRFFPVGGLSTVPLPALSSILNL